MNRPTPYNGVCRNPYTTIRSYSLRRNEGRDILRSAMASRSMSGSYLLRRLVVLSLVGLGLSLLFILCTTQVVRTSPTAGSCASTGTISSFTCYRNSPYQSYEWLLSVADIRKRKEDYHIHIGGNGPRLILYIRVSSSKQARGVSPEAQEEELLALAKKLNPSEIYVVFDYAKTGTEFSHRKTGGITRLQKAGLVDQIMVRHISRAGRESWDTNAFLADFIRRGGAVTTLAKTYRRTPEDFDALMSEIARAERENIEKSEAMRGSKEKLFMEGNWNHSQIPPGYRNISGTKKIEKDPKWSDDTVCQGGAMLLYINTFLATHSLNKAIGAVPRELQKDLKRDRGMNLLHNPILFGRPKMMKAVRIDESLRYLPDEVEPQLASIFAEFGTRYQDKGDKLFAEMVAEDHDALGPFLMRAHEHSMECNTYFTLNGTYADEDGVHLNLKCTNKDKDKKRHWITFSLPPREAHDWRTVMTGYDETPRMKTKTKRKRVRTGKDIDQTTISDAFSNSPAVLQLTGTHPAPEDLGQGSTVSSTPAC